MHFTRVLSPMFLSVMLFLAQKGTIPVGTETPRMTHVVECSKEQDGPLASTKGSEIDLSSRMFDNPGCLYLRSGIIYHEAAHSYFQSEDDAKRLIGALVRDNNLVIVAADYSNWGTKELAADLSALSILASQGDVERVGEYGELRHLRRGLISQLAERAEATRKKDPLLPAKAAYEEARSTYVSPKEADKVIEIVCEMYGLTLVPEDLRRGRAEFAADLATLGELAYVGYRVGVAAWGNARGLRPTLVAAFLAGSNNADSPYVVFHRLMAKERESASKAKAVRK